MDDLDRAQKLEEQHREASLAEFRKSQPKHGANVKAPKYRECEDCGEDIQLQRLHIFPNATRCIKCQHRFEQLQTRMR